MPRCTNTGRLQRAETSSRSRFLATTALIVAACVASFVPTAGADKPTSGGRAGGGSGAAITVGDGVYGGTTTASVSGAPSGTWVLSTCYQAGAPVIFNRLELDSAGQAILTLGPTEGYEGGVGGAECHAEARYWNLKRQRWTSLATTTFHVSD